MLLKTFLSKSKSIFFPSTAQAAIWILEFRFVSRWFYQLPYHHLLTILSSRVQIATAAVEEKKIVLDFERKAFRSKCNTLFPRVNLIKLFWLKFTHTFCKLDRFINRSNTSCIALKRSSLQKRVSNFTPKKWYEIDPSLSSFYHLKAEVCLSVYTQH